MDHNGKIIINKLCKAYFMYDTPFDRFKEAVIRQKRVLHTDFLALNNISFSVNQGDIIGIMGCNGAGKSTLLKIITGVLTPTSGTVFVEGKISSLLELGTGFNLEYTGEENIYFYGTLMGLTRQQVRMRFEDIASFAEIGDYLYQPVKTYSSGMFARLAFACAINVEPDILIIDEILSVGDIRFQAKCFNKFKYFKEQGVTILYVGHDVTMMKNFCDRAIWLNHGTLIMDGDPSEVAAKYVEFMYLSDKEDFTTYKRSESNTEPAPKQQALEQAVQESLNYKSELFPDSIAHWGTNIGLVKKAFLRSEASLDIDYFAPDDTVILGFEFEAKDIDFDVLSVAISIKNKEGTDIIVKTSYDEDILITGENGHKYHVEFKMKTLLAVGEYYLVIALENRTELTPMYYEYIDGALFFKVFTDKKIYGKVDVPAEIKIREVEGNGK